MAPPSHEADERILVEAAQRDPSRFAELYERNFDRVYAYVSRRVPEHFAAEDVTADVFRHALTNLDRFEWRGTPFVAWLLRIAAKMFYLYVPDADIVYRRALAAGAKSVQEPADQPYGDRNAAVLDAFGNTWYIATHVRVPHS